jgi:hypothetical protein
MKLITETTEEVQLVCEENNNKHGRVYPGNVLFNEVKRYTTESVSKNRAMGELGHPDGPAVNLERVSHLIKELRVEGSNVHGRAKIMDTPYGKIVKNLIDEGTNLGVSSRGMGSVRTTNGINEVQKDFMLSAVDIVADPSAPDAFVDGIMEGREWIWDNGVIRSVEIERYKKSIESASHHELEETKLNVFQNFLSNL